MGERLPKFTIGTKFFDRFKNENTIKDIYYTRNSKGELIKFEYYTEHEFMGQIVHGLVCETTIVRAFIDWERKNAKKGK